MAARGEGKAYQWIQDHVAYPHEGWCLIWPFSRDKHGRGNFGHLGKSYWAHRVMCTMVFGEPPTPKHTAAHNCGNGHEGCVNPRHLEWKTQAENLEDCRRHGTMVRHHGGNVRRLLPEQVRAIRGARGFQTQGQLAAKFGVSEGTISDIWHGRSHIGESKIKHWTPEDDAKLKQALERGDGYRSVADAIGRPIGAVSSRAYRLGLKQTQQC